MIGIVRVVLRMTENEFRSYLAHEIGKAEPVLPIEFERVVAEVEEPDVVYLQDSSGIFRLPTAYGLDLVKRPVLLPQPRALPALAVGQADNGHLISEPLV